MKPKTNFQIFAAFFMMFSLVFIVGCFLLAVELTVWLSRRKAQGKNEDKRKLKLSFENVHIPLWHCDISEKGDQDKNKFDAKKKFVI